MADKKIKDVAPASTVNGAMKIPVSDGGSTATTVTVEQLKGFVGVATSLIRMSPSRKEDGYLGTNHEILPPLYKGVIDVYNVENLDRVYVSGKIKLNNKCSYLWLKDANGKVIYQIDYKSASEYFDKFSLSVAGAEELWIITKFSVFADRIQDDINDDMYRQIEKINQETSQLNSEILQNNENLKKIDDRVKVLETNTPSTPQPPTPPAGGMLNHWKNRKIVWIGASVPKGQTTPADAAESGGSGNLMKEPYPALIAKRLECNVLNCSYSNISLIARRSPEGVWSHWNPKYGSSLSLTKQEIAATGSKFTTSYEDTIIANADADLFVFDNEPNNDSTNEGGASDDVLDQFDFANWRWNDGSDFKEHRNTYQGAVLFLLDELYKRNPYARVAFVSQFRPFTISGWDKEFLTRTLTRNLTKKLGVPYFELQDKLQYNKINKLKYITGENDAHLLSRTHKIIANILANEFTRIA